jgi:hypothetical protein
MSIASSVNKALLNQADNDALTNLVDEIKDHKQQMD